jgi:hypothetical protein
MVKTVGFIKIISGKMRELGSLHKLQGESNVKGIVIVNDVQAIPFLC